MWGHMEGWVEGKGSLGSGNGGCPFNTKIAASDSVQYSTGDAERRDLAYLVENSCISCNRLLGRGEVKVVPPRYIQNRDEYVRSGAVARRLMCVQCYNALKTVTRSRVRVKETQAQKKRWFIHTLVNNLLLKS